MAKYAVVQNGVVATVAMSETALGPNWKLLPANSPVWVGYTYDVLTDTYTAPEVPPTPTPLSAVADIERGTADEKLLYTRRANKLVQQGKTNEAILLTLQKGLTS